MPSEKLCGKFFQPYACPKTGTLVLGQAEGDPGVQDEGLVRHQPGHDNMHITCAHAHACPIHVHMHIH